LNLLRIVEILFKIFLLSIGFGDVVTYWDALGEMSNAEKTNIIKGLILNEVKQAIVPQSNNINS